MSSIIKKEETVPRLRFPEFDTLWEQISFSDIFDILQNNTYARADLNYNIGSTKNIHYGDILVKFNEYVDIQNYAVPFINNEINLSKFKSESYLRDGDIIIADTAEDETVGKVTEISNTNKQKVLSGLHTIPCRPKRKFAPMFLGFYMNSESFHKQLIPLITGIKVSSISKTSIATTTISVPLFEEQEKISKFMIAINNMIKEQESNLSILETYNRGLKMDILSQKIRFKDDSGNQYPDWKETTLGNIITPNIIETSKPTNDYIRLGIRSHCKGTFHEKVKIENILEADKMYLVPKDNLIVNITFAWEQAIAITTKEDEGKYVSGRFPTYAFNNNQLPAFYKFIISSKKLKYDMGVASPGGAGRNRVLNRELFLKIKITIPCLEEQEKIANFLTSLDNVLQEEKNYLEYLKTIKKGLLQQMFV